jgi:hypothetical protein
MIVGAPPGGGDDIVARLLGPWLARRRDRHAVQRIKEILIDERIAAVLAILATVAFFVFVIWVAIFS